MEIKESRLPEPGVRRPGSLEDPWIVFLSICCRGPQGLPAMVSLETKKTKKTNPGLQILWRPGLVFSVFSVSGTSCTMKFNENHLKSIKSRRFQKPKKPKKPIQASRGSGGLDWFFWFFWFPKKPKKPKNQSRPEASQGPRASRPPSALGGLDCLISTDFN